ncbi:ATP-binding cassette domain-containing protein [Thermoproteota archaeon]
MSGDIKSVLEGLNKKELFEIANQNKIIIPNSWSKLLIVELLALNVSGDNIQRIEVKPSESRIQFEGSSVIIIKDLVKNFEDVTAVDNLSLEIREGELFSLLGPNGAGKTTTMNILNGVMKPTKGTAIIAGFDFTKNLDEVKKDNWFVSPRSCSFQIPQCPGEY